MPGTSLLSVGDEVEQEKQIKNYTCQEELYADEQIISLLRAIDDREIADFLVNDFLQKTGAEYDKGAIDNGHYTKTIDYFRRNSAISAAVMANPGTSIVTEILYGKNPQGPIDEYFVMSNAGDSVYQRFVSILNNLKEMAQKVAEEKGEARIINLGSGPGTDTIRMLEESDKREKIKVTCLDVDKNALKNGFTNARQKGLEKQFNYVIADLGEALKNGELKEHIGQYDIGMLIGIICPLSIKHSKKAVSAGRMMLNDNGQLITSAAHERMRDGDPFTTYLMKRLGRWSLVFKDESDLTRIYTDSALDEPSFFYDEPRGYHMLAVGRKERQLS